MAKRTIERKGIPSGEVVQPGAYEVSIGDEERKFTFSVDEEGNVLNFRGADETERTPVVDEDGNTVAEV